MNTQEQAIFEARAIVLAHFHALNEVLASGNDAELQPQIDRLKAAAQRYQNLPRPQQKAA